MAQQASSPRGEVFTREAGSRPGSERAWARFEQFPARKLAASTAPDPVTALRDGCDDDVRFAAERPKLHAAMLGRVLQGASILAAEAAYEHIIDQLRAIGRLALPVASAADLVWASVNAAAQLFVTAQFRKTAAPDPFVSRELPRSIGAGRFSFIDRGAYPLRAPMPARWSIDRRGS